MIFLDNLKKFDSDMSAGDKADSIYIYIKEMKDTYEAIFKNFEEEIRAISEKTASLESQISALQALVTGSDA